jgi:hypothetical protein
MTIQKYLENGDKSELQILSIAFSKQLLKQKWVK